MAKFKKVLLSDKIPGILCAFACIISVAAGFGLGYVYFERVHEPSTVYAAEAIYSYQADNPFVASIPLDMYEPAIAEYHHPPEEETVSHLYVVTTLDGYIVVYHSMENGGGILELTSTSVCMLAPEELELLNAGIRIYTDEALARILQDYGS